MTDKQELALRRLCDRYKVPFDSENWHRAFDLPNEWVCGWVGTNIFVGCSPEGEIHS